DIGRLIQESIDHFDNDPNNELDRTDAFIYDLTGNRMSYTTDLGSDGSVDEAITYSYDANDGLFEELFDDGNDGTTDQTTTYEYDHTQQTGKTVVDDATGHTTSEVSFGYDLQGRMDTAVTTTFENG